MDDLHLALVIRYPLYDLTLGKYRAYRRKTDLRLPHISQINIMKRHTQHTEGIHQKHAAAGCAFIIHKKTGELSLSLFYQLRVLTADVQNKAVLPRRKEASHGQCRQLIDCLYSGYITSSVSAGNNLPVGISPLQSPDFLLKKNALSHRRLIHGKGDDCSLIHNTIFGICGPHINADPDHDPFTVSFNSST